MICKNCQKEFKERLHKIYCSTKCQKAAFQKRWYLRFPKDSFQWHNQKWIPSAIEDRIWVATGFESIKSYIQRRRFMTPKEMGMEINTSARVITNLIMKFKEE